jgi:hypothetical protein
MKSKKELIRVIKTEQEGFSIDTTGRKNGRGAYLCKNSTCLNQAIKTRGLERSFRCVIPEEVYEQLKKEMVHLETE